MGLKHIVRIDYSEMRKLKWLPYYILRHLYIWIYNYFTLLNSLSPPPSSHPLSVHTYALHTHTHTQYTHTLAQLNLSDFSIFLISQSFWFLKLSLIQTRNISSNYTLRIWILVPHVIATQSGSVLDHIKLLISDVALYAKIGSSIFFGSGLKSQMIALESSPPVQIWQELCGAHASALATESLWPSNTATGTFGARQSIIIVLLPSNSMAAT